MPCNECSCSSTAADRFREARRAFALAIANQKKGNQREAASQALACLKLLKGLETAEETAAGAVVTCLDQEVCEPSYLHVNTAAERFRQEKIRF